MQKKTYQKIGLIGRARSSESTATLQELKQILLTEGYKVIFEQETAEFFNETKLPNYNRTEFGHHCDLAIVVGGDGSILNAARAVVDKNIPVLGINRGRLGFLTDILPSEIKSSVLAVLAGEYIAEQRFLLEASIERQGKKVYQEMALNDVVLLPGDYAHMIEFEIFIDQEFVCTERADGQIIATPTGSTAYALSGGGPILHPSLNAVVLVPMFSHTLSNRPIVVNADSKIELKIAESNETSPRVSCDGQERVAIAPGDTLIIHKKAKPITILHPKNYHYFDTLRSKLRWQNKL